MSDPVLKPEFLERVINGKLYNVTVKTKTNISGYAGWYFRTVVRDEDTNQILVIDAPYQDRINIIPNNKYFQSRSLAMVTDDFEKRFIEMIEQEKDLVRENINILF